MVIPTLIAAHAPDPIPCDRFRPPDAAVEGGSADPVVVLAFVVVTDILGVVLAFMPDNEMWSKIVLYCVAYTFAKGRLNRVTSGGAGACHDSLVVVAQDSSSPQQDQFADVALYVMRLYGDPKLSTEAHITST